MIAVPLYLCHSNSVCQSVYHLLPLTRVFMRFLSKSCNSVNGQPHRSRSCFVWVNPDKFLSPPDSPQWIRSIPFWIICFSFSFQTIFIGCAHFDCILTRFFSRQFDLVYAWKHDFVAHIHVKLSLDCRLFVFLNGLYLKYLKLRDSDLVGFY